MSAPMLGVLACSHGFSSFMAAGDRRVLAQVIACGAALVRSGVAIGGGSRERIASNPTIWAVCAWAVNMLTRSLRGFARALRGPVVSSENDGVCVPQRLPVAGQPAVHAVAWSGPWRGGCGFRFRAVASFL